MTTWSEDVAICTQLGETCGVSVHVQSCVCVCVWGACHGLCERGCGRMCRRVLSSSTDIDIYIGNDQDRESSCLPVHRQTVKHECPHCIHVL